MRYKPPKGWTMGYQPNMYHEKESRRSTPPPKKTATVEKKRMWTIGGREVDLESHRRPAPSPPPLGKLRNLPIQKEPPSRSLIRSSDLRAHAKGAPVGMASAIFGFGTVRAKEEMIEIRVRLDSGTVEPVFVTAKVLARAVQKMRNLRLRATRAPRPTLTPDWHGFLKDAKRIK